MAASLTDAYNYVIDACNDPNIGYSLSRRTTIQLGADHKTYCDCSSLMSKALTVGGYFKNNPWFTTSNETSQLKKAGWYQLPISGEWKAGDILWRPAGFNGHRYGHTEMVYSGGNGKGRTMGAHTDSYAFAKQVSINGTTTTAKNYKSLWRAPGGDVPHPGQTHKWHMSNTYLDDYGEDQTDNAFMVYSYFNKEGFSNAAIAGLLGNMHWESRINPGMWEDLTAGSGGYGLVQWTPASGWFNWAASHNIDTSDADESGDGQCECVNDCVAQGQWLSGSGYSYTWAEYSQLTDYQEAVKSFMYQYERPGVLHLNERLEFAKHWYDLIESGEWEGDGGSPSQSELVVRAGWITDLQRRLIIPGRH